MSSSMQAVAGVMGRIAVRGVGLRISIGGVRLWVFPRGSSRMHNNDKQRVGGGVFFQSLPQKVINGKNSGNMIHRHVIGVEPEVTARSALHAGSNWPQQVRGSSR
jgi:hypothetical protein